MGGLAQVPGVTVLLELCDAGLSLGLCPDLHLHARERGGRGGGERGERRERKRWQRVGRETGG